MFTDRVKWRAAERELNMRRKGYPNLVSQVASSVRLRGCISVNVPVLLYI
jgi:hypothetical protein